MGNLPAHPTRRWFPSSLVTLFHHRKRTRSTFGGWPTGKTKSTGKVKGKLHHLTWRKGGRISWSSSGGPSIWVVKIGPQRSSWSVSISGASCNCMSFTSCISQNTTASLAQNEPTDSERCLGTLGRQEDWARTPRQRWKGHRHCVAISSSPARKTSRRSGLGGTLGRNSFEQAGF